eukprot:TRINITY_DN10994_c0_g1_i8.p1 TRINITY_DN10994_c0_g1~~TRINITY_DN10994_c0_g1_i8.p1  ORF type:complete len:223 (+),score=41.98 TRINITY_DN10994_c0_g1_i8:148-816(+)
MIRRPPRSTLSSSSAASDVYKRQGWVFVVWSIVALEHADEYRHAHDGNCPLHASVWWTLFSICVYSLVSVVLSLPLARMSWPATADYKDLTNLKRLFETSRVRYAIFVIAVIAVFHLTIAGYGLWVWTSLASTTCEHELQVSHAELWVLFKIGVVISLIVVCGGACATFLVLAVWGSGSSSSQPGTVYNGGSLGKGSAHAERETDLESGKKEPLLKKDPTRH